MQSTTPSSIVENSWLSLLLSFISRSPCSFCSMYLLFNHLFPCVGYDECAFSKKKKVVNILKNEITMTSSTNESVSGDSGKVIDMLFKTSFIISTSSSSFPIPKFLVSSVPIKHSTFPSHKPSIPNQTDGITSTASCLLNFKKYKIY